MLFSTHILAEAERLRPHRHRAPRPHLPGTLDELRAESGAQFLEQIFKVFVERASLAPNA
ncbi:MAG: hypothetical protein R3F17_16050 [Planctomycetota bacterium]